METLETKTVQLPAFRGIQHEQTNYSYFGSEEQFQAFNKLEETTLLYDFYNKYIYFTNNLMVILIIKYKRITHDDINNREQVYTHI